MNWLRKAADLILRRPPRPDDERRRQARVVAAVKVQHDAAITRADKALNHAHRMGLRERVAGRYSDINHYGNHQ